MYLFFIIQAITQDTSYTLVGKKSFSLKPGKYLITCFGAQGGRGYSDGSLYSYGGKGAKVSGYLTITGGEKTFYAYVGGQGTNTNKNGLNEGGWNGGGKSGEDTGILGRNIDGAGGGGGASDIRLNSVYNSRIMVAAGGSGGACQCNGAPGGKLKGMKTNGGNGQYTESDSVTQSAGNINGVGSDGHNSAFISGSGAGGGWRGGITQSSDMGNVNSGSYKSVGESGSSYISGYPGCTSQSITFDGGVMESGNKENNGKIQINVIYICSDHCSSCTSATSCSKCFSGYVLEYGKCVLPPTSHFTQSSPFSASSHFIQSSPFSSSYHFSQSSPFSASSHFTGSSQFTESLQFTGSSKFSTSSHFTNSYQFTQSYPFSDSSHFAGSSQFTESLQFTCSSKFSYSSHFPGSSSFSLSSRFTESSFLSTSSQFTKLSPFNASFHFMNSLEFTQNHTVIDYINNMGKADSKNKKSSIWIIVGIVLGVLVIIATIIVVIILVKRNKKDQSNENQSEEIQFGSSFSEQISENSSFNSFDNPLNNFAIQYPDEDPFERDLNE